MDPPLLKIPSTRKRILQTNANDEYWGAVLIEEIEGKRNICDHASGQFKNFEKHYHTIYKEILAIKNEIKKIEFHLIWHCFLIIMDNSSFSKVLDFKNKSLHKLHLLRLKN